MNRLKLIMITSLLLSLFGFALYGLYLRLEMVETTSEISLSGEARNNPLYAAGIFLKRMGIPVESRDSLQGVEDLPATNRVLLISSARTSFSREYSEKLLEWVIAGGHLIIRTTDGIDYEQLLEELEDSELSDETLDYHSEDPLQELLGLVEKNSVFLKGKPQTIRINGSRALSIELQHFDTLDSLDGFDDRTDKLIKIKDQTFILNRELGKGMVSVLSQLKFINNRNIRKADHAEILWYLAHSQIQPQAVVLVYGDEKLSLIAILWRHAWAFIISITLLLLLWLYRAAQRFGPIIPKQKEQRRSLLEHIQASGNFYWKHKQKYRLVQSARKALEQRLSLLLPGWQQLSQAEKIAQLVKRSNYTSNEIHQLLFDQKYAYKNLQADEFTSLIQKLENIRNAL